MQDKNKTQLKLEPSPEFRTKVMQEIHQHSMEDAPSNKVYVLMAALVFVALPIFAYHFTATQHSNYLFMSWHESIYRTSYIEILNLDH